MAANRRTIREAVVRSIFECEFRSCHSTHEEVFVRNMLELETPSYDLDFAKALMMAVFSHMTEFQAWIEQLAPEWPYSKIARLDRAVICAGLAELKYLCHTLTIPLRVTVNEYIEITKTYGDDSARKFVNGVLSSALKTIESSQHA